MSKQKTRYRVREIYDQRYDVSNRVWADLPLNTPLMFIAQRTKSGQTRFGFKRLTPPKSVSSRKEVK